MSVQCKEALALRNLGLFGMKGRKTMLEQSSHVQAIQTFHRLTAETETPFSVMTEPKTSCTLSLGEGTTPIRLDADDHGVVRFHVTADKTWQPTDIALAYVRQSGESVRHTLSLRDTAYTGTATPNEVEAIPPPGTLRPALEGDPMALSAAELVANGYPPRPDPKVSPESFARWLKLVSVPFTAVDPRRVTRPDHAFGHSIVREPESGPNEISGSVFNSSFSTWAGAYLTNPVKQFYSIEGSWQVPNVKPPGVGYAAAAQWVGLDNQANLLFQSGSDSEVTKSSSGVTVTSFWMWIERLPFAPSAIPNLPVAPLDTVIVQIFVADQNGQTWFVNGGAGGNGGLTAQNNSVWFMLHNTTKNQSYWGTLPSAAQTLGGKTGAAFAGRTAEFIVEQPTHNGGLANLAFFGTIRMQGCGWGDSNYGDQREFTLPPDTSANPPSEGRMTYLNMAAKDTLVLVNTATDTTAPSRQAIVYNWQRAT